MASSLGYPVNHSSDHAGKAVLSQTVPSSLCASLLRTRRRVGWWVGFRSCSWLFWRLGWLCRNARLSALCALAIVRLQSNCGSASLFGMLSSPSRKLWLLAPWREPLDEARGCFWKSVALRPWAVASGGTVGFRAFALGSFSCELL